MLMGTPDVNKFRPCHYKKHKAFACMPPIGTVVLDPLQVPELIEHFGSSALTEAEVAKMDFREYQCLNGVLTVNVNTPVLLCGVYGDLQLLSFREFINNYRVFKTGEIPAIAMLQADWVTVEYAGLAQETGKIAQHIPVGCTFYFQDTHGKCPCVNGSDVSHGEGDFVVADAVNSAGAIINPRLVNGWVFKETYNNSGWGSCLGGGKCPLKLVSAETLPNVFKRCLIYPKTDKYSLVSLNNSAQNVSDVEVNFESVIRAFGTHGTMIFSSVAYISHILLAVYQKVAEDFRKKAARQQYTFESICKVNVMTYHAGTVIMQFKIIKHTGTLLFLMAYEISGDEMSTGQSVAKVIYKDKSVAPLQFGTTPSKYDFHTQDTTMFDEICGRLAAELIPKIRGRLIALEG